MADELTRGALEGLARLRRKGLISEHCPNADTCKCPQHSGGLARFAPDPTAYLEALSPTRLRVVTMGPPAVAQCSGSMTCICTGCTEERAARKAAPPIRQPWQPVRRAA